MGGTLILEPLIALTACSLLPPEVKGHKNWLWEQLDRSLIESESFLTERESPIGHLSITMTSRAPDLARVKPTRLEM
jgi:hypothetical protein